MEASGAERITVLLVDDHPVVRHGIRAVLQPRPDFHVVGMAGCVSEAVEIIQAERPDAILLDVSLPDLEGPAAVEAIRAACSGAAIIMLSVHEEDRRVAEALEAGAIGYVVKGGPAELIPLAIRAGLLGASLLPGSTARTLAGRFAQRRAAESTSTLAPRELDVLRGIGRGLSNRDISNELNLAESTIKKYVYRLLTKLEARDRAHAAVIGMRSGWLD